MSALKFTSAQQRKNQTVSTKQSLEAANTANVGKVAAPSTSGEVTVPTRRSETPKMVRSRPKLPSGLVDGESSGAGDQQRVTAEKNQNNNAGGGGGNATRAGHSELDKLVGILNVLGTTDFVRKYSRKGRSATSSPAIPLSPTPSDLTSPRSEKSSSPPPLKRSGSVTPTRLRSIRVRLEKVKEDRDKQAEMEKILAKYTKHRKTQVIDSQEDGDESQRSQSSRAETDDTLNTSFSSDVLGDNCSEHESVVGSGILSPTSHQELAVSQSVDSACQTSDSVSKNNSDICHENRNNETNSESFKSSSFTDLRNHSTPEGVVATKSRLNEDLTNNNGDKKSDTQNRILTIPAIKTPSEDGTSVSSNDQLSGTHTTLSDGLITSETCQITETLPSKSLTVTSDLTSSSSTGLTPDIMRRLSEGPDDVFLSPVKKTVDDEGYIEESDLNVSMDSDVCSAALSGADASCDKQSSSDIPKVKSVKDSLSSQIAKLPDFKNGLSDKGLPTLNKTNRSTGCLKTVNGRFLTHPPSSERTVQIETGVVDSYGFSPLSREPTKVKDSNSPPKDSQVSLADSQIAPSETSDMLSADSLERLDRKNGKSPKQKSKSDPCGQNKITYVDLPKVISSHANSVPILSPNAGESASDAKSTRKSDSDAMSCSTGDDTKVSLKQKIKHKKSITKEVSTQTKEDRRLHPESCDKTMKEQPSQDSLSSKIPSAKPKLCTPQDSVESDPRSDIESSNITKDDRAKDTEPLRPERPKRRQRLAATAALKKQMPKAKSLEEPSSVKEMHSLNSVSMTNMARKPPDGRLSVSEKSSPISEDSPSFPHGSPRVTSKDRLSSSEKSSPVSEHGSSFASPQAPKKKKVPTASLR